MKPFDLEKALEGDYPVVTQEGNRVELSGHNIDARRNTLIGWIYLDDGSCINCGWNDNGESDYPGYRLYMAEKQKKVAWFCVYKNWTGKISASEGFSSKEEAKKESDKYGDLYGIFPIEYEDY